MQRHLATNVRSTLLRAFCFFFSQTYDVQKDNIQALSASSLSSLGSLRSILSGALGKDLTLSKGEFEGLNALLHKTKDHFERLIILLGFFKEKIHQSPKEGSEGLKRLSELIEDIDNSLKKCGVSADAVFNKLRASSFIDPRAAKTTHELTSELTHLQKAQEGLTGGGSSLLSQYRHTIEAMAALKLAGKDSSQEYDRSAQRAAKLKGALASVNKQVSSASLGKEGLSSVITSVNGLVGVFGAAQGTMALFGGEGKKMEATLVKLNGVLAILNSLSAVQASLHDRNSLSFKALCYVQGLYATALNASAAASVRLAAATKLLGWGLLIGAVAAAASALQRFSQKLAEKNKLARLSVDIDKEAKKAALSEQIQLKMLLKQAESVNTSREKRLQLIRKLNELMPEFNNSIDEEAIKSGKAAKAVEAHAKAIERRARAQVYAQKKEDLLAQKLDIEMAPDEEYLGAGQKIGLWLGAHLLGWDDKNQKSYIKNRQAATSKNRNKALASNTAQRATLDKLNDEDIKANKIDYSPPDADKKDRKEKEKRAKKDRQELEKHQRELKKRQQEKKELAEIERDSLDEKKKLELDRRRLIIEGMREGFEKEKAFLKVSLEEEKQANKEKYENRLKTINKFEHLSEKEKKPLKMKP